MVKRLQCDAAYQLDREVAGSYPESCSDIRILCNQGYTWACRFTDLSPLERIKVIAKSTAQHSLHSVLHGDRVCRLSWV